MSSVIPYEANQVVGMGVPGRQDRPGVVKQNGNVDAVYCNEQIVQAAPIAPADIYFRDMMSVEHNPLGNAAHVDVYIIRSNVD